VNRFQLSKNEKLRMKLRGHELNIRIETLSRHIKNHAGDPDFRRSLVAWRRELMDAKLERAGSGLSLSRK
jgi:hypothetical protein